MNVITTVEIKPLLKTLGDAYQLVAKRVGAGYQLWIVPEAGKALLVWHRSEHRPRTMAIKGILEAYIQSHGMSLGKLSYLERSA